MRRAVRRSLCSKVSVLPWRPSLTLTLARTLIRKHKLKPKLYSKLWVRVRVRIRVRVRVIFRLKVAGIRFRLKVPHKVENQA